MTDLTGKVAIVTGASKGIGAGIAKHMAAAGAAVVVNYSSSKADADKIVAEIEQGDGRAVVVQGDISQAADVERLFAEAKSAYGKLDILVNNAAAYEVAPLEAVTEDSFHRMFNTNVLGLILATQEAVKQFGEGGGSVINIGSTVTSMTPPMMVIYTATKGAVDTVTRTLAKELGPKSIRVNSINPGGTNTEGSRARGMDADFSQFIIANTPLGRMGQPDDIAKVAVFLASDDASWVTGEIILASGGLR